MLIAIATFLVGAIVVPYLFVKQLGLGVWRRARRVGVIGLSFDDGPDPEATPRVLDLLSRAGVRATFFVSGEATAAHPALLARLVDEGHEVASHGHRHKHALFQRWPLEGFFDTRRAVRDLERRVGRTRFYRAPFGAYSFSVLAAARICGVQPVNWTIEAHDWHPRFAPPDVVDKVLAEAHAGGVIVMHDGGRGGKKSVHALGPILEGLRSRNLLPVPLSELWA